MIKANNNIYDKLIIILICSLIFGIIGGALRPVRVIIVLCLPIALKLLIVNKNYFSKLKKELFFFTVWFLYALVSVVWVKDLNKAIKGIIYLFINFSGFFSFLIFAMKANNPIASITNGWLLLFILTVPIALFELVTNIHLSTNTIVYNIYTGGGEIRNYASVTFGNLNGYNTVLCFVIPFSLISLISARKNRNFKFIILLLLCCLILMNSSRAAFLCLIIGLGIFLFKSLKNGLNKKYVVYMFLSLIFVFINYYKLVFSAILSRFGKNDQGFEDKVRTIIYDHSIEALQDYYYLGTGVGNFQAVLQGYITELSFYSAHSFLLEILVEYGVIIFLLFAMFLYRIVKTKQNRTYKSLIKIYFLLTFIILTIINSNYLYVFDIWAYMGSVYYICKIDNLKFLNSQIK